MSFMIHKSCLPSGFSGADLSNLVNEAALLAAKQVTARSPHSLPGYPILGVILFLSAGATSPFCRGHGLIVLWCVISLLHFLLLWVLLPCTSIVFWDGIMT